MAGVTIQYFSKKTTHPAVSVGRRAWLRLRLGMSALRYAEQAKLSQFPMDQEYRTSIRQKNSLLYGAYLVLTTRAVDSFTHDKTRHDTYIWCGRGQKGRMWRSTIFKKLSYQDSAVKHDYLTALSLGDTRQLVSLEYLVRKQELHLLVNSNNGHRAGAMTWPPSYYDEQLKKHRLLSSCSGRAAFTW